jgi:hypothetical protein
MLAVPPAHLSEEDFLLKNININRLIKKVVKLGAGREGFVHAVNLGEHVIKGVLEHFEALLAHLLKLPRRVFAGLHSPATTQ